MNYLAHLYLSEENDWIRLGNLMGDFVKGRLKGKYPPLVEKGIQQHRSLDRFAFENTHFRASWERLDSAMKYIRPILVDIFYDHFLAKNWDVLHPTPLAVFSQKTYHVLKDNLAILPVKMKPIAKRMIELDWLTSYADIDTIDLVLLRMNKRFRRPVDLTPGSVELRKCYLDLERDCTAFLQEARAFVNSPAQNT